jgi:hypothetical protein
MPRTPVTFLQVFEQAMSSKGKGKLEDSPDGDRGFTPPHEL